MTKSDYKFKKFIEPFGLTDTDFDLLINYCEIVQFKKGDIVIHEGVKQNHIYFICKGCLLYTSPSPRDRQKSRMPSSA